MNIKHFITAMNELSVLTLPFEQSVHC